MSKRIMGLALVGFALLIVGVLAFMYLGGSGMDVGSGKHAFQCKVVLDGDVFTETDIVGEPYCTYTGKCSMFSNMFALGFLDDQGTIVFKGSDGVDYAYMPYKVSELPGRTAEFTLKGCIDGDSGEIIVLSENYDTVAAYVQSGLLASLQDSEQDRVYVTIQGVPQ